MTTFALAQHRINQHDRHGRKAGDANARPQHEEIPGTNLSTGSVRDLRDEIGLSPLHADDRCSGTDRIGQRQQGITNARVGPNSP